MDGTGLSGVLAESGFGAMQESFFGVWTKAQVWAIIPRLDNITQVPWAQQGVGQEQTGACSTQISFTM